MIFQTFISNATAVILKFLNKSHFMNQVYGLPSRMGIGLGDGNVLAKNLVDRFRNIPLQDGQLAYIENGTGDWIRDFIKIRKMGARGDSSSG